MKLRILIVEDHVGLSLGLARYLATVGYVVHTANSVKSAVKVAKENQFDLLLVDLNLPDGTGWDLLREVKTKHPVRAIATSGWGGPEDVANSEAAGFMRHLVKPVTPEELIEAIEDVMRRFPSSPGNTVVKDKQVRKALLSSSSHVC